MRLIKHKSLPPGEYPAKFKSVHVDDQGRVHTEIDFGPAYRQMWRKRLQKLMPYAAAFCCFGFIGYIIVRF